MVERQLRRRGLGDARLLAAFGAVPRERFVDPPFRDLAYADRPLPIGAGQTISQPYVVALMIDSAAVGESDRILEVGAGSGYAAAILGFLAKSVIAVERCHDLAVAARARLADLRFENVAVVEGDGSLGWPEGAPYDAIIVSASGREAPPSLIEQLAPGGRLVMPLGAPGAVQQLIRIRREQDGGLTRDSLGDVRFVPLIGEEGWPDAVS